MLRERLRMLERRITSTGRDPGTVRVVAVTKGMEPETVTRAMDAGLHDIGENYATELLAKAARLGGPVASGPRWHYLGAIQRRRVRDLAGTVALWQTVARLAEGESIARRAPGASVLVELELSGLAGRNGCAPGEAGSLVDALRRLELDVQGVMVVAPPGGPEQARRAFRTTATVADDLGLRERSMGMSDDLEVALEEGATIVRVGRALFGPRPVARRAR